MDDVKDKLKRFVKNPFASSTRFKGEGHKLGSAQDFPSAAPAAAAKPKKQPDEQKQQQGDWRRLQQEKWEKERGGGLQSGYNGSQKSKVTSQNVSAASAVPARALNSHGHLPIDRHVPNGPCEAGISEALRAQKLEDGLSTFNSQNGSAGTETMPGFNPFATHIGSTSSDRNVAGLEMFQCPVCGSWWKSEKEVSAHVDDCLGEPDSAPSESERQASCEEKGESTELESGEEQIKLALGTLLSGGPSNATLDVIVRLIRNVVNDPASEKYRKIRMSNPKIHETVGMALGGVELLEAVGFGLQTEGDEIWAVMEPPSVNQIRAMKQVIADLETHVSGPSLSASSGLSKEDQLSQEIRTVNRKVDRQVRVFHAAPENLAAKIELPDSFFELSAEEMRQEAATRRKKLEDSQLLIPKSFREKKAAATKQRYKAAIIRVQFSDGVVLQGMFLPREPTTAIYEFVSSSLKDPNTSFDLVAPACLKNRIIPSFTDASATIPTLEEADLIPATLVKFQPTEPLTFTGLHTDLLATSEPLSSAALPVLVKRL